MITVILTIHVLIVLALIGVVLLQRSDGGALGIGGGGGGMMSSRSAANALTRTTSILAALFFTTSIGLAIFADQGESQQQLIEDLTGEEIRDPNEPTTAEDLLRTLGSDDEETGGDTGGTTEVGDEFTAPTAENLLDALGATETISEAEGGAAESADAQSGESEEEQPDQ